MVGGREFWIDRGGTFTDVVAWGEDGRIQTIKLLSENPGRYADAAVHAIRQSLVVADGEPIPPGKVRQVLIGTTLATNALLERKGARTGLLITRGFRDLLEIGYQDRPELFALRIVKPASLASFIVEVDERILADGSVRTPIRTEDVEEALRRLRDARIESVAVVLLNSYTNPEHELAVERAAQSFGFRYLCLSHRVAREIKAVPRGDTTLADAYLTPIIRDYVAALRHELGPDVPLKFMQSAGGLVDAERFRGKDAILSGPAGGVVACRDIRSCTPFKKLIGFDMGGTSTDVSRVDEFQHLVYERPVAGVRVRAPMFRIETVAAGGGSILAFHDGRFTVGPESAGANPGPACYGRNGPATVTDANVVLGRIHPRHFPASFGPDADGPLDAAASRVALQRIADEVTKATGRPMTVEEAAAGFIRVANENMARPIREITAAEGVDVREYALVCFGGAAAQHACAIADALGICDVLVHEHAGVLSAYGMGMADVEHSVVESLLVRLEADALPLLDARYATLEAEGTAELCKQGFAEEKVDHRRSVELRYDGMDATVTVPYAGAGSRAAFEQAYERVHGYTMPGHAVEIVNLRLTSIGRRDQAVTASHAVKAGGAGSRIVDRAVVWFETQSSGGTLLLSTCDTPVYAHVAADEALYGPAIILDPNTTIVVDPGWSAKLVSNDRLSYYLITRGETGPRSITVSAECNPVSLEILSNLFMSIADQMGDALECVAHSVNMKERLDFSCAIFDPAGELIANAHHIPVHLGAMSESVKAVLRAFQDHMEPGDVYATNDPYRGGSHLPDVTVVTPVFDKDGSRIFVVANRGHHADIGGITPGSMPPFSRTLDDEGVVIRNFLLVSQGRFREKELVELLDGGAHPARNLPERLSDLRAQVAANHRGVQLLRELCEKYSLPVVHAYMGHVRANAAESMRRAISELPDGRHHFEDRLDCGARIACTITVKGDHATVDFTGTDPQLPSNLNAPPAVTIAAVLYVFRTLIARAIPLNSGCLEPITIRIPEGSLLNPRYPAAVVGGNVETSQRVCDILYGALGALAASQGTMNNFTFGNERFGYYETICGGAGAGRGFHGAGGVHVHMTNTRITDPEVMEHRYPVVVREFSIRTGSGGKGEWNGGDGVSRSIEFREAMRATLLTERRTVAPFGLCGGLPGACGRNRMSRRGLTTELPGCCELDLQPGDVVMIETPGGGGYGAPRSLFTMDNALPEAGDRCLG